MGFSHYVFTGAKICILRVRIKNMRPLTFKKINKNLNFTIGKKVFHRNCDFPTEAELQIVAAPRHEVPSRFWDPQ